MGCWNKTCGLSNLHIKHGDEVYVFVLEENTDKTERCYSTAFWRPVLLPFVSKYNDYGGGEESSGAGFQLIMDSVANQLTEMGEGKNKYHDIPVKKEGFGEEQFFEAVHEHRLFTTNYRGGQSVIDFVMMRKDVVDHILENRVIEKYVGEGHGTSGYGSSYITYKFEDILKDLPEFMDKLDTIADREAATRNPELIEALMGVMSSGGLGVFGYNHSNKVNAWLRGDTYRYSSIVSAQSTVLDLLKNGNRADAESLVIDLLKGYYINGFMEYTRKNWGPAGHEGSQGEDPDGYRVLISAMTHVLDVEKTEWDAENGED